LISTDQTVTKTVTSQGAGSSSGSGMGRPSSDEILQPGATFRGLTIHSILGRGAMGTAYLASHPILQVPHVIKTFHGATDLSIFREAYLGARVSSPHIVNVLDAGIENGVAFCVQQYIDGLDLADLSQQLQNNDHTLPLELVVRLISDTARGLHALHQAGVVHCDIKPANLFLSASGAAMVGDFGIATETRVQVARRGITGTPVFMAPEQWQERPPDRRADLYALGGTAHLLLTGKPPFDAGNTASLCMAHVMQTYKPPTARSPREAYLFSVIERLMRKEPDERYPSAEALNRELETIRQPAPRIEVVSADRAILGPLHVALHIGDLTTFQSDVLVNAANTQLHMEAGVALALRRAGGDELLQEAKKHAPAAMGDVIWTGPGRLPARFVAHAVAAQGGAICLGRTTLRTLLGADARKQRRVAFPAMGIGVGLVPPALAAKLMMETFATFAALRPKTLQIVDLVLLDEPTRQIFREVMHSM